MKLRIRTLLMLIVVGSTLSWFIWIVPIRVDKNLAKSKTHIQWIQSPPIAACHRPDLDVNDSVISKFFTPSLPIECDSQKDLVCIDRGIAHICDLANQTHGGINCNYTFLNRKTDHSTVDGKVVEGGNGPVTLISDFFKVSCKTDKGVTWSNIMAGIKNDSAVHSRTGWDKVPKNGLGLNVMMWGFDSLSRNTFIRKLPKTYSFITDNLEGIVLKGYNIVGDGTPQALIPILTGKTEPELPETRKRMPNAQSVNVYPFVWKEFQKFGYVTAFTEDAPSIGTFTYRLKGFSEQPTEHYMRAFYVAAEKQFKDHKRLCLRGTPRHKVLMNWVHHFFDMYADKPKFIFTFHNELSHDDFNLVGSADEDLVSMIKKLKEKGHLNRTLLIIMSDHGHRFAKIREYQQGKLEERLPFFAFVFPPWVKKKHPKALTNFQKNAERLTTPFDIYPTLWDIVHLQSDGVGNLKNRSISLFTEVPLERTCEDADIDPHWCTCLDWKTIPTNDSYVVKAANAVVGFFNKQTEPLRDLCEVLSLNTILSAGKYTPSKDLLKFKKNADLDGFKPDLTGSTKAVELFQVKIHTLPGDGHFEVSLTYDVTHDTFTVKEGDISRTNKYGNAAACVSETQEQLRKFCYCKT